MNEEALDRFSFDAFLCYRRRSGAQLAQWLDRRIRRYRLPPEVLAALESESGRIPKEPLRTFLDVRYERARADFWDDKIVPALRSARRLLVIVTPEAFEPLPDRSPNWMEREIEYYVRLMGEESGLGAIIALGPGASDDRLPGQLHRSARWDWSDVRLFRRRHISFRAADQADDAFVKIIAELHAIPDHLLPILSRQEARRRARTLRGLAVAVVAIAALLAVLTQWALRERSAAIEQRNMAIASSFASEAFRLQATDRPGSLLHFLASLKVHDNARAKSGLFSSLQSDPHVAMHIIAADAKVTAIASDPRSARCALGLVDGHVLLAPNPARYEEAAASEDITYKPLAGAPFPIVAVAFVPECDRILGVGSKSHLYEWDLSRADSPPSLLCQITEEELSSATFSASPDVAISASADAVVIASYFHVHLWRKQLGTLQVTTPLGVSGPVALSADGHLMACAYQNGDDRRDANSVGVYDLESSSWVHIIPDQFDDGYPTAIAFSPDARRLITGRSGGAVQMVDLSSPALDSRHYLLGAGESRVGAGQEIGAIRSSPVGDLLAFHYRHAWILWLVQEELPLGSAIEAQSRVGSFSERGTGFLVHWEENKMRRWDFDMDTLRKWALVNTMGRDLREEDWNRIAAPLPYQRVIDTPTASGRFPGDEQVRWVLPPR